MYQLLFTKCRVLVAVQNVIIKCKLLHLDFKGYDIGLIFCNFTKIDNGTWTY